MNATPQLYPSFQPTNPNNLIYKKNIHPQIKINNANKFTSPYCSPQTVNTMLCHAYL